MDVFLKYNYKHMLDLLQVPLTVSNVQFNSHQICHPTSFLTTEWTK